MIKYKYYTEMISEQELHDMAGKIFSVAEQDFEKVKLEKWYQTLFHAITLNQNGKEYAVKGICSLAKLQQLFMEIYITFYKENHSHLDRIMNAIMVNSEAIKKLYGVCVLNLEEQQPLSSLNEYDANILALFLGEYRNSEGEVPDEVKKYNRGVLKALNQSVPKGTLDNHQLDKLEEPKVVYRCFMEQCAVDGTIDSQEWTDKIYEDLKYFNLSDNSKSEIKELVKHEAEIAGVEYFITKYTKDNLEVIETDFEIDIEAMAAQENGQKNQFNLNKICNHIEEMSRKCNIIPNNYTGPSLKYLPKFTDKVKDEYPNIKSGLKCLNESLQRSLEHDYGFIYFFALCDTDNNDNEYLHYALIATIDGFFVQSRSKTVFLEYSLIRSVKQRPNSLTIVAKKVRLCFGDTMKDIDTNKIKIKTNSANGNCLIVLRKCIEHIIEDCGGYIESSKDKVEKIIEKYIQQIPKNPSAVPYMVKDFGASDYEDQTRLNNALHKYALKVRKNEVIGFIDTSLTSRGKSGILFSQYGIAFKYYYEKIFIKYEEILSMSIKNKKKLVLYGYFSERETDNDNPFIEGADFNLHALKKCLKKIRCVI